MSDLHLETPRTLPMYSDFNITAQCRHLALLGDIGSAYDSRLYQFLALQVQQFDVVFFVVGNHEPYTDSDVAYAYEYAIAQLHKFEASCSGRFVLLDRARHDVDDGLTVLGCTLFSRISETQSSTVSLFVSDFSNIPGWTIAQHNALHERDVEWLNKQVDAISRDEPQRQIVILTHYSPTMAPAANDPEHLDDPRNVATAFATDLSGEMCWTAGSVKAWVFGHTHFNCDYVDEATGKRVVANQRGYGREDMYNFDADKVIELADDSITQS